MALLADYTSGHGVAFAGTKMHVGCANIGGFNAEEFLPLSGTEVAHGGGLVGPRVPDDCGSGILLANRYRAAEDRIDQVEVVLGIEVNAIRFGGDANVAGLGLFGEVIDLVDVAGTVEAADGCSLHVAEGEVGVQCLFKRERRRVSVGDDEFQLQLLAEGGAADEMEIEPPPFADVA